ncbi:MAG TPA: PIG-L deacetylase family protein [Burkholderiaceae bacterium]|nr:PIG-L deacetylase family protein [Burkholderiaceae bacterium]
MLPLRLVPRHDNLRVLCLGAHSDDIEIGCAGTLLRWLREYERVDLTWCVLSAGGERAAEATRSARALTRRASSCNVLLGEFEDGCLPADYRRVKDFLTELRSRGDVDVVLTHCLEDRHQDHRLVAELTWQIWRDHLVLEYEIPKYEGDLGHPNLLVSLPPALVKRKIDHLLRHFASQRSKSWFSAQTFEALMRIRGVEARAASGWAEGFQMRKAVL